MINLKKCILKNIFTLFLQARLILIHMQKEGDAEFEVKLKLMVILWALNINSVLVSRNTSSSYPMDRSKL